jgi:hypothetical protein
MSLISDLPLHKSRSFAQLSVIAKLPGGPFKEVGLVSFGCSTFGKLALEAFRATSSFS